jgi:hypothetical protein
MNSAMKRFLWQGGNIKKKNTISFGGLRLQSPKIKGACASKTLGG